MNELEDDLRSVAESMSDDAARLKAIEDQKATLPIEDPRMPALAEEAERLANLLAAKAGSERDLVEEAAASS